VNWVPAGGGPGFVSSPFIVEGDLIPTPGALGLLAIALCGARPRRRIS
jgi:hypothetical protein